MKKQTEKIVTRDRTDSEILHSDAIDVRIGGRSGRVFNICPLPRSKSREFRARCAEVLNGFETVTGIVARFVEISQMPKPAVEVGDVTGLMPVLVNILSVLPETAIDLIYQYSDELAENKEWIENNGTDAECLDCLLACVRLAYGPFVLSFLKNIQSMMKLTK
jgi:hypothetical protein